MTAPQSDHDLLIRMDAKLDLLVGTVNDHSKAIERIDGTLSDHGNRLTGLETLNRSDDSHHDRSISAKAAFWTAVGSICIAITLLVSFWIQHR
jgi:hypothetical protein